MKLSVKRMAIAVGVFWGVVGMLLTGLTNLVAGIRFLSRRSL